MWKNPNCPNCGGRSFGMDGEYHECQLCERPTEEFHAWYRSRWPEAYEKFSARR